MASSKLTWMALIGLAACNDAVPVLSTHPAGLSLGLPGDTAFDAWGLAITAVEVTGPSDGQSGQMVRCGEIGSFPPTTVYLRAGSDLDGIQRVFLNRDFTALGGRRAIPLPHELEQLLGRGADHFDDANPWQAIVILAETREPTNKDDTTTLEGCTCIRLNPEGSHPDPEVDQVVKSDCPPHDPELGLHIPMEPVAKAPFRVEICDGTSTVVGMSESAVTTPNMCVRTTLCDEGVDGPCFECRDPSCEELSDLSGVPMVFEVEAAESEVEPVIAVSNELGQAQSVLEFERCPPQASLRVYISGRRAEGVVVPLRCVPPPNLDAGPVSGQPARLVAMSTLPAHAESGRPARLLNLIWEQGDAVLLVLDQNLDEIHREVFPSEMPRGLLGFAYDLSGQRDLPYVAVATTDSPFAGRPKVRLLREQGGDFEVVDAWTDDCPSCACNQTLMCPQAEDRPCDCQMNSLGESGLVNFVARDIDGDQRADLAMATEMSGALTVLRTGGLSPDRPPPFMSACQCTRHGREIPIFDFADLGGRTGFGSSDLVLGAQLLYGEHALSGARCESDADCVAGRQCVSTCDGQPARCLTPCAPGSACDGGYACFQPSGGVQAACMSPGIGCSAPQSVALNLRVDAVRTVRLEEDRDSVVMAEGHFFNSHIGLVVLPAGSWDLTVERHRLQRYRAPGSVEVARGLDVFGGHFNADEHRDVVTIHESASVIWFGGGEGALGSPLERRHPRVANLDCHNIMSAVGDFDGDGLDEIAVGCSVTNNYEMELVDFR